MSQDLKCYVGYDSREDIAWRVCRHSIARHTAPEVGIHPLRLQSLRELGLFDRADDTRASTEFSISRFLTPYLAATEGWSIFMDCDFLLTVDVREVLHGLDSSKAIFVVKHDYVPARSVKMDGKVQHTYPRKNWSSFMVLNGRHPKVRALTPRVVNQATPEYLHRFQWLDDKEIGGLPPDWNFLVGEYPKPARPPAAIHYTNGGPWFENCRDADYADLWLREKQLLEQK